MSDERLRRGHSALAQRRFRDAVMEYDFYLAAHPQSAEAWHNRGVALCEMKRFGDAIACFDRTIALAPAVASGWRNRGTALLELERFEEAARDLAAAVERDPDFPYARGYLMLARLAICDWRDYSRERAVVVAEVRNGRRTIPPFGNLFISSDPADQLACARAWLSDIPPLAPMWRGDVYRHAKIRIAYVSADFGAHPVGILMAGVLERHDKSRFEIDGIALGKDDGSAERARIQSAADQFVDARAMSDAEIAATLRAREIDIAVDLMGLTRNCRPEIFAHRPAPAQVNFLGYPGTLGLEGMDYIVADETAVPEAEAGHYRERVVRLPHFMPMDDKRAISVAPSRAAAGLPERSVVLCSFNQTYKVQPDSFSIWMRILRAVDGAVLWLPDWGEAAQRNLRREAVERGIDPERLVFAPRVDSNADHLARLSLADLFLDTLPCNAHSTACDALWAGVPIVTQVGTTFAGRIAASLVRAAGLPELATASAAEYEALAIALARDPARLAGIRAKLARREAPLFDTERYTRSLERAYERIHARVQSGMAPHSFSVAL